MLLAYKSSQCAYMFELVGCVLSCYVLCCMFCSQAQDVKELIALKLFVTLMFLLYDHILSVTITVCFKYFVNREDRLIY
jgi:hypothetical protein